MTVIYVKRILTSNSNVRHHLLRTSKKSNFWTLKPYSSHSFQLGGYHFAFLTSVPIRNFPQAVFFYIGSKKIFMSSYLVKICIIWTFWTKGVVEFFFSKSKKIYKKNGLWKVSNWNTNAKLKLQPPSSKTVGGVGFWNLGSKIGQKGSTFFFRLFRTFFFRKLFFRQINSFCEVS